MTPELLPLAPVTAIVEASANNPMCPAEVTSSPSNVTSRAWTKWMPLFPDAESTRIGPSLDITQQDCSGNVRVLCTLAGCCAFTVQYR